MRTPMESYVVRVYRRRSGAKRQLVGVLEGSRLVGAQAFSSVEELWEILEGRGSGQPAKARARRSVEECLPAASDIRRRAEIS